MGQAFGAPAPQVASVRHSEEHEQYIPSMHQKVFHRDEGDREALNARETSLVDVRPSEHLARPRAYVNQKGQLEARDIIHAEGLYARVDLPRFTVVGEYRGEILTSLGDIKGRSDYRFAVRDLLADRDAPPLYTIDGKRKRVSSIVRYANAADDVSQVNAEFVQYPPPETRCPKMSRRVFLMTTKKIKKGTELISWYGEDTDIITAPSKKRRAASSVHTIERILERRRGKGKDEFLVRWEGYDADEDSWVPEDDILDAHELAKGRGMKLGRPA